MSQSQPPLGADRAMMVEMAEIAREAARQAGDYARSRLGSASAQLKDESQLVTEVDRLCQAMIVERVRQRYGTHGILAEEGREAGIFRHPPSGPEQLWWVIDPLDGTRNFVHGLPIFAVSIGVMEAGKPIIGVIYDPNTATMFSGHKPMGARCNDQPIRCYHGELDANSQIALPGRNRRSGCAVGEERLGVLIRKVMAKHVYTALGSAALHYAYVASGAVAGMCSWELRLWDIAAGAAIAEAAGALVTKPDGTPRFPLDCASYQGEALPSMAAGPMAHRELLKMLGELPT